VSTVLKEAKRLYDLGFAIHWVKPKSKAPVNSGWTTGPRMQWRDLEATYKEGFNVGVRTGSPSQVEFGYLACIDIDVKDPSKKELALQSLKKLVAMQAETSGKIPEVSSGSGNGSGHLYVVTARPFKMITFEKGEGWEAAIYSDGRQMVLPPSIHPSGRAYTWKVDPSVGFPTFDFTGLVSATKAKSDGVGKSGEKRDKHDAEPLTSFEVDEVELEWLPISDQMRDAIVVGTGVKDRSGFLLKAATALMSAGLNQNQVLTVLTDKSTYLGHVGYDHAQTNNRKRAAQWVHRYSLKKVSHERNPTNVFASVPVRDAKGVLTLGEEKEQAEEFGFDAKENGFYKKGPRGARVPLYDELLKHFAVKHPFKTIADMKAVYIFGGTHFEHIAPLQIKGFAEENFAPKPDDKIRGEFLSKVLVNNLVTRDFFTHTTEGRINFKNGVLDVSRPNAKLEPHGPHFGFRGVLPYDYDPTDECPFFKKWIIDLMLQDMTLVHILQEFMGYVVRGGPYKYHKALWLGGVGRNGKSTFIDLFKALIGAGNFSTISIKSLVGDKFVGADLDGKIANFSEETSPQELADSGPFKNLTGDGDISAQKKYGDPFHFRNRAKLIMTYNQIPDLKDLSKGMLSRPIIIPFKKVISDAKQDRDIKDKLMKELPGIFNFALEGWKRLEAQNGFTKSDASDAALEKIKDESCNVHQWVEHYVEFGESDEARTFKARELYTAYTAKERFVYKMPEFFRRLNKYPGMNEHRKHTNKGTVYFGLKF
jgi:putative DNA primase/helicase